MSGLPPFLAAQLACLAGEFRLGEIRLRPVTEDYTAAQKSLDMAQCILDTAVEVARLVAATGEHADKEE